MKRDTSRILYDRYLQFPNRNIEIRLKNGSIIHGKIAGYFSSDTDNGESPIHHWRITDPESKTGLDFTGLGRERGKLIRHGDIASVTFEDDHTLDMSL
jgi:hypothetical protein